METQRENVLNMLERRGYDVEIIQEDEDDSFRIAGVLVVFIVEGKVSVGMMKSVIARRTDENQDEKIIIVHANSLTAEAKNVMNSSKNIETFTFDQMAFDLLLAVPHHSKVHGPKHKDWKNYPVLSSNDAVVKYFDFKKGDVVRIKEDDGTISHRRVV